MYPNAQSGYPASQYPYNYSAAPSYYYSAHEAGAPGTWQQPHTSTSSAHGWAASGNVQPVQGPPQSWVPPPPREDIPEPPPPGTAGEVPPTGGTGDSEEGASKPPPVASAPTSQWTAAGWQTNTNYWQQWQTPGWGGGAPGVEQWNGQWPPQSYWGGTYAYGNQACGYTQPGNQMKIQQPTQQDGGCMGMVRTDRTPPPPAHQDATPPPAAVEGLKDHGVHQPRIQQYCQAGYTTELPAVVGERGLQLPLGHPVQAQTAHPPPEQAGKLELVAPNVEATASYSVEKATAHQNVISKPQDALPLREQERPCGLPPPEPQQQFLQTKHHNVGQYDRSWEGRRETEGACNRPFGSPARKRRSRWEQPAAAASGGEQGLESRASPQSHPAPQKKAKASPPPLTPEQWPPKLRDYIDRAFAACEGRSTDLERVQQFLKEELNNIFKQNKAWDVDWDHKPLPLDSRLFPSHGSRWDTPSPQCDVRSRLSYGPITTPTVRTAGRDTGSGRGKRKRGGPKKKRGGKFFFIDKEGEEMTEQERQRLNQRAQRFAGVDGNRSFKKKLSVAELVQAATTGSSREDGDLDWEQCAIEGTSQALEKPYLRLTSAPDPSTVRPVHVLWQSLAHVTRCWQQKRDYRYTCEQLKSIRQDLTIQGVRNEFAVVVYETHARIALGNGDRGEFNQCQAQLKALYLEGVAGQEAEFVAYRILYLIMTHNSADMSTELRDLTSDLEKHPHVAHALRLWSSWQLGNYCQFFHLYKSTPGSGRSLVQLFLSRERLSALRTMLRAYRPSVPVAHVSHTLAFSSLDECTEWLAELGLPMSGPSPVLDCKVCLPLVQAKSSS